MKKQLIFICSAAFLAIVLTACGNSNDASTPIAPIPDDTSTTITEPTASMTDDASMSTVTSTSTTAFTADELAKYDGKDGNPAYVAVDGVVYDVTNVPQWAGGEHYNGLEAGQDQTDAITNDSPHGLAVLDDLPVVGTYEG